MRPARVRGSARPDHRSTPDRAELERAGWALPVGFGGDERGTRVGTVHSTWWSSVDRRGAVTVPLARSIDPVVPRWCLDWLIGADDRWHVPSAEAAVRQHLVDGSPVVETRLRIPGGDAVHRVFGVRGPAFAGGDEYLVIEVENETPVPFALAFVVRPFSGWGEAADIRAVTITAGEADAAGGSVASADAIRLDDRPVVLLPRRPARAAGAVGWVDVVDVVTSGRAPVLLGRSASAAEPGQGPTAAVIFPLPHRATLRVLLPLGAEAGTEPPFPAGLPDAARVANGWAVQSRRGPRVELPDWGLRDGIGSARRGLLLAAVDEPRDLRAAAALVAALDREGFAAEASSALAGWPDRPDASRPDPVAATPALAAIADHWRLTRDDEQAEALLPLVVALLTTSRRAPDAVEPADAARTRRKVAELLAGIGQVDAALTVEREAERLTGATPAPTSGDDAWLALRSALDAVGPTWTWPDGVVGLDRFLAAARAVLVEERPGGLALLPAGIGAWWGQGVELHDAPTPFGSLSFAVRWHGDRPAVLWDLQAPPGGAAGPVALTAPALDPAWSTTERKGEALLAPVARPPDLPDHTAAPVPAELGGAESVAPRSVLPLGLDQSGSAAAPAARHDDDGDDPTPDPGSPEGSFS